MILNSVLAAFGVICFLLAFLAGFILFFINKEQIFSNRILAIVLFFLGIQSLIIFLLYSGLIIKIPHVYRMFGPTTLLIFPLSYIYVRTVLDGENSFKRMDWIILIPFILYAINLLPVYCMSYEKKLELVTNFVTNPKIQGKFNDGFLPPYVFSFFRTIWSAYFLFLQFKLINQFRIKVNSKIVEINKELLSWLCLFSKVLLILVSVHSVFAIVAPIFETSILSIDSILQLLILVLTLQLFIHPRILYGIFIPSKEYNLNIAITADSKIVNERIESNTKNDNLTTSVQTNLKYKEIINSHFKQNLPFLNPDYNLNILVDEVQIPRHLLSTFINQEYGIGFRKFLNQKRIDYILENFNKTEWKNLTLEAIANESGFKNRSTFINNFKEVTGKNPLEYFKNNNS